MRRPSREGADLSDLQTAEPRRLRAAETAQPASVPLLAADHRLELLLQIRELYAKYGPKNFAVVGVALDTDKAQLAKYLQGKPIPWPQLHETGGLDGRLAEELGVLTLPTMLLIDADGKVVDRNLVITDLEKKLEAMVGGK